MIRQVSNTFSKTSFSWAPEIAYDSFIIKKGTPDMPFERELMSVVFTISSIFFLTFLLFWLKISKLYLLEIFFKTSKSPMFLPSKKNNLNRSVATSFCLLNFNRI